MLPGGLLRVVAGNRVFAAHRVVCGLFCEAVERKKSCKDHGSAEGLQSRVRRFAKEAKQSIAKSCDESTAMAAKATPSEDQRTSMLE
jgi:hypothetical protein